MSQEAFILTFLFDRFFEERDKNDGWSQHVLEVPLTSKLELPHAVKFDQKLLTASGDQYPMLRLIQRSTDRLAIKTTNSGLSNQSDRLSGLLLYKINSDGTETFVDICPVNEDRLYTKWEAFKTFAKGAAATVASPFTLVAGAGAGAVEGSKVTAEKVVMTEKGPIKVTYNEPSRLGGAFIATATGTGVRAGFEAALGDTYLRKGSRLLGKPVDEKSEEIKKQWLKDFDSNTPYSVPFTMQIDKIQFKRAFPGQEFTLLASGVFSPVFISETGVLEATEQNLFDPMVSNGKKHGRNRGAVTSETLNMLKFVLDKTQATKEKDKCRDNPNCLYFIGGENGDHCRYHADCIAYWNDLDHKIGTKTAIVPPPKELKVQEKPKIQEKIEVQ